MTEQWREPVSLTPKPPADPRRVPPPPNEPPPTINVQIKRKWASNMNPPRWIFVNDLGQRVDHFGRLKD
eukprot:3332725-Karenia_brevis.AAC.1